MSRSVAIAAILALLGTLLWHTLLAPPPGEVFDVHAFVAAGKLVLERGMPVAYRDADVAAMQRALSSFAEHLPWSYPPATTALVTPLGLLGVPQAHFVIAAVSLAAALAFLLLQDAPPAQKRMALFLATPPLIQAISTGTPAPLFATLVALALASPMPLRLAALGLKPHIALGLGIPLLTTRDGLGRIAFAAAIGGAATLAVEVFAPGTFVAWLGALADARSLLASGYYPLHRMASAYAFFRQLADASTAAAVHLAIAVGVLGATLWLVRRDLSSIRARIALMTASLLLPPYVYDYDLVVIGLALVLLPTMPRLGGATFSAMLAAVLCNVAFNAVGLTAAGFPPPTFAALAAVALLLARATKQVDATAA